MESILKSVGDFGLYQKSMFFIVGLLPVLTSTSLYSTVFTLAEPYLICIDNENQTAKIPDNFKCKIWQNISDSKIKNNSHSNYECYFDKTFYHDTMITEFNMICEKKVQASLLQTWFLAGTFASLFVGFFSDKYGRKKVVLICLMILCTIWILNLFTNLNVLKFDLMTRYLINSILQFVMGVTCNTIYVVGFILLCELTTNKYCNLVSTIYLYLHVSGEIIILIVSFLAKNWIIINIFVTMLSIFILAIALFFMPESPRFLLVKNKLNKASDLLNKIKKKNYGKSFNPIDTEEIEMSTLNTLISPINNNNVKSVKESSVSVCIEIKRSTSKILLLVFIWFAINMSYYGVSLGITSVGDLNPYIVYILSALAELIGYSSCYLNEKFNQKKILIINSALAGICCICSALIPHNQSVVKIIFALFGKALVSAFFNSTFSYTNQMFPTEVRNTFLLLVSSIGNIGAFISPQINLLQNLVWKPLPYIIFGSGSFIACVFVSILPDPKKLNYF